MSCQVFNLNTVPFSKHRKLLIDTNVLLYLQTGNAHDYGFHLFRHTHASLMLNSGANWKELQERMGHRSISTTMDIYAELDPNRKNEAVDILMERLSKIQDLK